LAGFEMAFLDRSRYRSVVVLSGAGVSVASGLRPFRGPGGLWEEPGAVISSAESLQSDATRLWALFSDMRRQASAAHPNAAHAALAAFEKDVRSRGGEFTLITQNIDGLHQRAGSANVVELHGSLFRARCSDLQCRSDAINWPPDGDAALPPCSSCGRSTRPDIVLFDEPIPAKPEWDAKRALRTCDLFLAVGTSGTVSPASNFVRSAAYSGARTILVNLERMSPRHPDFEEEVLGPAEETLPRLLGETG
jgi:NAD-dependent deacetylase